MKPKAILEVVWLIFASYSKRITYQSQLRGIVESKLAKENCCEAILELTLRHTPNVALVYEQYFQFQSVKYDIFYAP